MVMRRTGRFRWEIACPRMVVKRGECFRAVDSNDQMRMSDIKFDIISRKKAWPVVHWGVHELIIVDIWLICRVSQMMRNVSQQTFRWQLLVEILDYAKNLEETESARDDRRGSRRRRPSTAPQVVGRFDTDSVSRHHHCAVPEYVTWQDLNALHEIHGEDIDNAPPEKRSRARDAGRVRRMTGARVVRNPYWHTGQCVVCWAAGKRRMTSKYCRECAEDPNWTYHSRRRGTFKRYTPRLCSRECWVKFHGGQVYGLDHHKRQQRTNRARGPRTRPMTVQSGTVGAPHRPRRTDNRLTSPVTVNFNV